MNDKNLLELLKQIRSSALIDGICMGAGALTVSFSWENTLTLSGFLTTIGGILVITIGVTMEVYHWARLPLVRPEQSEEKISLALLLRCVNCGKKTAHVLTEASNSEEGEIEEIYQCLQCGEINRIIEPASAIT